MRDYKQEFIEFARQYNALRFGEFTLKSGRISPYFFNAGVFSTGKALAKLGKFYADAIVDVSLQFDVLFGPAYKGIPLVSAAAIGLAEHHHRDMPYCFNRKVAKDHGEGGQTVGHALSGRVLLIDDVITAGTAIAESMPLLQKNNAVLAGVVVMLDRMERGTGTLSAIDEVRQRYKIPVLSIITLEDILVYLKQDKTNDAVVGSIEGYVKVYGAGKA